MSEQAAHIGNIPTAPAAKKTSLFTSAVSATALICLFVTFGVMMLDRI